MNNNLEKDGDPIAQMKQLVEAGKQCGAMTCYNCRTIGKVKRWGADWSFECKKCGVTACGRN